MDPTKPIIQHSPEVINLQSVDGGPTSLDLKPTEGALDETKIRTNLGRIYDLIESDQPTKTTEQPAAEAPAIATSPADRIALTSKQAEMLREAQARVAAIREFMEQQGLDQAA